MNENSSSLITQLFVANAWTTLCYGNSLKNIIDIELPNLHFIFFNNQWNEGLYEGPVNNQLLRVPNWLNLYCKCIPLKAKPTILFLEI